MKKFLAVMASIAILAVTLPTVLATDICAAEPLTVRNFNAEITSAVNLRTVSCMQESTVITTLSGGEIVQVIGTTEGWHKIRLANGTEGWIWETFLTQTDKPFNPSTTPETEPYVEPEPVTYEAMRDIAGHKYEDAIWYVYNNGIVQGYEDGSYKPDQNINRAELLKIVVESKYGNEFEAYQNMNCFSDVYSDAWYAKYVCFAKDKNLVEGYNDGSFRPANNINFVEALKIVLIGMGYDYEEGDPWFRAIVELASEDNFIPLDVDKFDDLFTRGQMAEMITRIMKFQADELDAYLGEMKDAKITYEMLEY
jgi:hypothetical protein